MHVPAAAGESKPGVVFLLRLHQQQALKSAASVPTSALVQFDASGSGLLAHQTWISAFVLLDLSSFWEVGSTSADSTCSQAHVYPSLTLAVLFNILMQMPMFFALEC